MRRKLLIMSILAMLTAQVVSAQGGFDDLLRYSQKFYQGDARSVGVGNAMGAFGADPVSMSINPAGIGLYRHNEFSFGLGFENPSATTTYLGQDASDMKYNFNISNLNLVIASMNYDRNNNTPRDGWVAFNFGIGFNRTNSFQDHVTLEAQNNKNSIVDYFANQGNGYTSDNLDPYSYASLALANKIIANDGNTTYSSIERAKPTIQRDQLYTTGSTNDIAFTFGGNYSNKVYVGASLMFPTIAYHYTRTFTETHINPNDTIQNVGVNETVNTTGIGITANFGIIFRASDYFRIGGAIQLPTIYSMSDDYSTTMSSTVLTFSPSYYSVSSPQGSFDYSIITPFRFTANAALIAGKNGFIGLDFEHVNYANAIINTSYDGQRDANNLTAQYLQAGNNIRLGGEYRYELFAFRAGLGLYSSPYSTKYADSAHANSNNGSVLIYSFGLGYHPGTFFMDFAYQVYNSTYVYAPYAPAEENNATVKETHSTGILTMGWKF